MKNGKVSIVVPILLIVAGVGGILTELKIVPDVDWIWVLALALGGILTLVLGGIDKVTVVVGPFLFVSAFFSLLRQTGRLSESVEIHCLVIVAGALALVSRFLNVPTPNWWLEANEKQGK